ncbi:hypothetical protein J7439_02560 [Salinisphaera sp. G21_0]|nr:hypothetical protein [Salinisphaera sp. G21_0]MBO9480295.1 hypothetical protein [Salinisphaera sp. G21_0]
MPTVQAAVEAALSKVANHPVAVVCAGRTDARVHGCNQIIHFDTDAVRTERGWAYGANANLPDGKAMWVNIQHPATSFPASDGKTRPRSSTVTRDDGEVIGA